MNVKNEGFINMEHLEQQDEEISTIEGEIAYLKNTSDQLKRWGFFKLAARIEQEIEELGGSSD